VPHTPDFLLNSTDPTNFMRLSSKEAAHAAFLEPLAGNPGISLVFREMWDVTNLAL
jgi:hypothetical protein